MDACGRASGAGQSAVLQLSEQMRIHPVRPLPAAMVAGDGRLRGG